MKKKTFFTAAMLLIAIAGIHAQTLNGIVFEMEDGKKNPLTGVNVYWEGTQIGTSTDRNGRFSLTAPEHGSQNAHQHYHLVVSFVGYKIETLHLEHLDKEIEVVLQSVTTLKEVEIKSRQSGTYISRINPIQTQIVGSNELRKAACCNLSESFETNASVDVNYSDAITGAKQIQMLGLAGIYTQMMIENIPSQRGLANPFGLGYVPGSWMESIQISKGSSAVINGYESITGQINVEYKKPHESERLFLNLYANSDEKAEANITSGIKLNPRLSTILMAHAQQNKRRIDHNHDHFLDMPLTDQLNFANRWLYYDNKNIEWRFGISVIQEERMGGQTEFEFDKHYGSNQVWGYFSKMNRYEAFSKLGILFPDQPHKSIGIIVNGSMHEQKSIYGMKNYFGEQQSFYSNVIYQSILSDSNLSFSVGSSYMYDSYHEQIRDSMMHREESVPGAFLQLTYNVSERMTTIAGIRVDHNSLYGTFITPRIHTRFHLNGKTSLRLSAGKGYRSPAVFAENQHLLASSRSWIFYDTPKHEEAWNYGLNLTRHVEVGNREISLSADFYRTDFLNQVIIDLDQSARNVYVYNLKGKSYSNSFQLEANGEILTNLEMTLAYRFNDVKMTINNSLREKPLTNRYKALASMSYLFPGNRWKIDFTTQLNGPGRVPSTSDKPQIYRRKESFDAYTILLGQISYSLKRFEVYVGGENLTDYRQANPVIASDDPFGSNFDSSLIWAPLMGRTIYAGLRWKLI
jgi:outer membrane receptor for ferrienterochelin and colicin